jgi:hypothetical protein
VAHGVTPRTLGRSSQGRPYDPRLQHRDVHPHPHRAESGRDRRGPRRGGEPHYRDPAQPLGCRLSGHHGPGECQRIRLSLRQADCIPRRGGHLAGGPGGRDCRGLRQTLRRKVAHDLRGRRRARHVFERLRAGRAAVQADSRVVRPRADPVRAAVRPHAAPRPGAVRVARGWRGQGVPPRASRQPARTGAAHDRWAVSPRRPSCACDTPLRRCRSRGETPPP